MSCLLLKLRGPMQSWGSRSLFGDRDTGREPTFSGIVGICCAALGMSRDADLSVFDKLKMHVRVDREGKMDKDFQTAQDVITADMKFHETAISKRWHLQDAAFLVCLDGDENFLSEINRALQNPVWPIALGRRSYVPSEPVFLLDGLKHAGKVEEIFQNSPLVAEPRGERIRLIYETGSYADQRCKDKPVSFDKRTFKDRFVTTQYMSVQSLKEASCI